MLIYIYPAIKCKNITVLFFLSKSYIGPFFNINIIKCIVYNPSSINSITNSIVLSP